MAKALTPQQQATRDKAAAKMREAIERRGRLPFGSLRVLPSGRVQARYTGPDEQRHTAPRTWDNIGDASAWLNRTAADIDRGNWVSPKEQREAEREQAARTKTLDALFAEYMAESAVKARTRDLYTYQWQRFVSGGLGARAVADITPEDIATWRRSLPDAPRQRQQANDLVRAVLGLAVERELIPRNPATTSRRKTTEKRTARRDPARTFRLTPQQVQAAADAMPAERRFAVLLTAGTGLRFGEMAALRRSDLDIVRNDAGEVQRVRIHVRRAVERAKGADGVRRSVEGSPKTEAGVRSMVLPTRLHVDLMAHLEDHAQPGEDGLIFPGAGGALLTPTTLYGEKPTRTRAGRGWYRARVEAGVPAARWHLLRHYAISEAVDAGATPAVLRARFGHTDMATSAIYQHAAENADALLADRL